MRVLIASWCFAPYNTVGAVRLTKLAAHLLAAGHDVRVVTADAQEVPATLPQEIPKAQVVHAPWLDVEWPVKRMSRLLGRGGRQSNRTAPIQAASAQPTASATVTPAPARSLFRHVVVGPAQWALRSISDLYFAYLVLPDKRVGWLPYAIRGGKSLAKTWQPDVVYASGPPFTSLLVGKRLAVRFGVPWIAELRDPWFGSAYTRGDALGLHNRLQRWLEGRTLRTAAAIVATTDPLTAMYAARYAKPSLTVYNGFDPIAGGAMEPGQGMVAEADTVSVSYTGHIYPGKRDPSPLFAAIACLDAADRARVRVDFYGCDPEMVRPLAQAHAVEDRVTVHPSLPYTESLRVQHQSDTLLLLQWNDPREHLHLPAKLFEYIGSGRPIIGIGYEAGIPADIVRERRAGIYQNDPEALAGFLRHLIQVKGSEGRVPALPDTVRAGFARFEQFARLQSFIAEQVEATARQSALPAASPADPCTIVGPDYQPVDLPPDQPLRLIVVCDTEEEFDWSQEFKSDSRAVTHLEHIDRVQSIFERHGICPVYVVDYPVADQPAAARVLRQIIEEERGVLGAHLQPWVSPPHHEILSSPMSYPGNLPADLEREKLERLTARIAATFGQQPVVYKAGRYGIGPNTAATLQHLGYEIDLSVAPPMDLRGDGGPDFSGFDTRPFWFGPGRSLFGLPNTGAFAGLLHRYGHGIHRMAMKPGLRPLRLGGILSRLRLVERIRLSNEGHSLRELKSLSRHLLRQGERTLVFSFHSPSVAAGFTPYVRTEADLAVFLNSLDQFLAYAIGELGAVPATPQDVRAACMAGNASP